LFGDRTILAVDGVGTIDHEQHFRLFQEELEGFKGDLRAKGTENQFLGAKVRTSFLLLACPRRPSQCSLSISAPLSCYGSKVVDYFFEGLCTSFYIDDLYNRQIHRPRRTRMVSRRCLLPEAAIPRNFGRSVITF
jgi:hypothetical protein